MIQTNLVLLITMLVVALPAVYAQEDTDLTEYEDFFMQKEEDFTNWLSETSLENYLSYERLEVKRNKVNLVLKSDNWQVLSDSVHEQTGIGLAEVLMNKSMFVFNLEPEQLLLKTDTGRSTLFISYQTNDDRLELTMKSRKNQGTISDKLELTIADLKFSDSETYTSEETVKDLKKKIFETLDNYFKEKEVRWKLGDYSIKPYFSIKNQLKVKVRNVQNIVKRGFYEAINVDFFFEKSDGKVQISYDLNCKYGSGIFFSPFEEDYQEIAPDKMKEFNTDLQELILTALTY